MKCSAWTNCIWGTIVHLILIILFAIFAFDNPDPEECWVTSTEDVVLPEEPIDSTAEYYNYGSLLRIYFGLGFFYYAIDMVKSLIHYCGIILKSAAMINMQFICQILNVGFMALVVFGVILRWSSFGHIASGDNLLENADESTKEMYMVNSGKFMTIYLVYIFVSVALACLMVCCGCCALTCVSVKFAQR